MSDPEMLVLTGIITKRMQSPTPILFCWKVILVTFAEIVLNVGVPLEIGHLQLSESIINPEPFPVTSIVKERSIVSIIPLKV